MSVIDGNLDLIGPLTTLSIKDTTVEPVTEIVEGEADYKLLPVERLLNGEVYLSFTSVSKKRHRTFWGFQRGEEIIRKHDGISCWLCSFCEAVNVTNIKRSSENLINE